MPLRQREDAMPRCSALDDDIAAYAISARLRRRVTLSHALDAAPPATAHAASRPLPLPRCDMPYVCADGLPCACMCSLQPSDATPLRHARFEAERSVAALIR